MKIPIHKLISYSHYVNVTLLGEIDEKNEYIGVLTTIVRFQTCIVVTDQDIAVLKKNDSARNTTINLKLLLHVI